MLKPNDKKSPLVSVLMSVYNPNITWLEKQLLSINSQTIKDMEIIICDDCPENHVDEKIFYSNLTNFEPKIFRNEKRLGSTKTFEKLTKLAKGKYISYCDQDDIWFEDRIESLVSALENYNGQLAYSDAYIINSSGKIIGKSLARYNRCPSLPDKQNVLDKLLIRNFISGATMLVRADTAKSSLPFESGMYHDHYIALYTSVFGKIIFVDKKLMMYRRHKNNQTQILNHVKTKNDYLQERLVLPQKILTSLEKRFDEQAEIKQKINQTEKWFATREIWWQNLDLRALKFLMAKRKYCLRWTMFEIIMARLPNFLFEISVKIISKLF